MAKKPAETVETPTPSATTSGQDLVNALNSTNTPITPEAITETPPPENVEPVVNQTEPTTPVTETATETQTPEFVAKLQELGFSDVKDEADGRERLAAAYRQQQEQAEQLRQEMEQLRQMAALGQRYAQQMEDPAYQQFQAQRQPAAQPTDTQPEKWWNPPAFSQEVAQRYRETKVGPDGEAYVDWKANTPAEVKQGYEKYQQYVEDWSYNLVNRPQEILPRIIQTEAEKIVKQMIEERFGEVQQQTELERLTEEIRTENPWMYQVDPVSNRVTEQYSEAGQRVLRKIAEAQEYGLTNPRAQWEYARNAVVVEQLLAQQQYQQQPPQQAAPVQQPATPQQTTANRNVEYLQRQAKAASSRPGRTGSAQASSAEEAGQRAGRRRSPGHDFLEELQRTGAAV